MCLHACLHAQVGGNSIYQMLMAVTGGKVAMPPIDWLGISLPEFGCFALFWVAQVRPAPSLHALAWHCSARV